MERIFWLDLEMSGLDVEKEVIIEVGAIITDCKLNEIEGYHSVVKQPQQYIDGMDAWNTEHHGKSGLTELIPSGKDPDVVENDLLNLADQHFPRERVVIAGNSIGQDRKFIKQYFTRFEQRLHYRMLDVTSWKIIYDSCFDIQYEKKEAHRADLDIKESIAELKYYMDYIKA